MSKEKTGCFIAVEGADGVGKSTVLRLLLPQLLADGKTSGVLFFHWKPVKANLNEGGIPETVAQDPRGSTPRNAVSSFIYLGYHWLSFLFGYLKYVAPALRAGKLVIADRYTYDVMLDPRRFRLNVPKWMLRVFVQTLPQPDVVLALVAEPETIVARKHELTVDEINTYQNQLKAGIISNLLLVQADASPEQVAEDAFVKISDAIRNSKQRKSAQNG